MQPPFILLSTNSLVYDIKTITRIIGETIFPLLFLLLEKLI